MTWAIRDGPLEKLRGGGRAKYKKNIRARQISWNEKKIHARQLTLQKIHASA